MNLVNRFPARNQVLRSDNPARILVPFYRNRPVKPGRCESWAAYEFLDEGKPFDDLTLKDAIGGTVVYKFAEHDGVLNGWWWGSEWRHE